MGRYNNKYSLYEVGNVGSEVHLWGLHEWCVHM